MSVRQNWQIALRLWLIAAGIGLLVGIAVIIFRLTININTKLIPRTTIPNIDSNMTCIMSITIISISSYSYCHTI